MSNSSTATSREASPPSHLPLAATAAAADDDMNPCLGPVTRSSLKRKLSSGLPSSSSSSSSNSSSTSTSANISMLPSPPHSAQNSEDDHYERQVAPILPLALHVLATEAAALAHIHQLYASSSVAQASLLRAVHILQAVNQRGGKLVVCGVGKSGLVGTKTVASMKSLGLAASFLHAAEALHGDLGDVRAHRDAVMFISFSGKTGELLNVLPHIHPSVPILALTGHTERAQCPLLAGRDEHNAVLLPATVPVPESESFGVAAPTSSTTVALAVGDMLAMTTAERVNDGASQTKAVFARNHPGGAIGTAHLRSEESVEVERTEVRKTRRRRVMVDETSEGG